MTRSLLIHVALVMLLMIPAAGAAVLDDEGVIYVESGVADRSVGREKIQKCVKLLEEEMGLGGRPMPTIVVIHVSRQEGDRAGLKKVSARLRANFDQQKPSDMYYELWLAGEASTYDYVFSLHYLLARHFALNESESDQSKTIARVMRFIEGTVSARK